MVNPAVLPVEIDGTATAQLPLLAAARKRHGVSINAPTLFVSDDVPERRDVHTVAAQMHDHLAGSPPTLAVNSA